MTFSLVLLRLGFRNKDIVEVTGWLPPRITNSVITAEALYASDDNYRMMVDTIIKSVKASII
jgi:hypothetical protein